MERKLSAFCDWAGANQLWKNVLRTGRRDPWKHWLWQLPTWTCSFKWGIPLRQPLMLVLESFACWFAIRGISAWVLLPPVIRYYYSARLPSPERAVVTDTYLSVDIRYHLLLTIERGDIWFLERYVLLGWGWATRKHEIRTCSQGALDCPYPCLAITAFLHRDQET